MASNTDQVINILNDLIEVNKDRENGYKTASESIKDESYLTLFRNNAQQSARFASELQSEVRSLGGDPQKSGSVSAWFHRGWINIKSAVTGGMAATIIAECERGEDSAVSNYQSALKEFLPTNIQSVVQRQYSEIKEAHDHMRALEISTSEDQDDPLHEPVGTGHSGSGYYHP